MRAHLEKQKAMFKKKGEKLAQYLTQKLCKNKRKYCKESMVHADVSSKLIKNYIGV